MASIFQRGYTPRGYGAGPSVTYGQDTPNPYNAYEGHSGGMVGSVMFGPPPALSQPVGASPVRQQVAPAPVAARGPGTQGVPGFGGASPDYFAALASLLGFSPMAPAVAPQQGPGGYFGQQQASWQQSPLGIAQAAAARPRAQTPETPSNKYSFGGYDPRRPSQARGNWNTTPRSSYVEQERQRKSQAEAEKRQKDWVSGKVKVQI